MKKKIVDEIILIAKERGIKKIILFGSRARDDNHERSDIDIAVSGGDILNFSFDIDEKVQTLLIFDVINLDRKISKDLQAEINRDGVVIYEEI